jgi:hypothetical protein
MSTEIRLSEGESIRVSDEYREVYERLAAAGWQNPVEFKQHHGDGESVITLNPAYIVYLRPARQVQAHAPASRRP